MDIQLTEQELQNVIGEYLTKKMKTKVKLESLEVVSDEECGNQLKCCIIPADKLFWMTKKEYKTLIKALELSTNIKPLNELSVETKDNFEYLRERLVVGQMEVEEPFFSLPSPDHKLMLKALDIATLRIPSKDIDFALTDKLMKMLIDVFTFEN